MWRMSKLTPVSLRENMSLEKGQPNWCGIASLGLVVGNRISSKKSLDKVA